MDLDSLYKGGRGGKDKGKGSGGKEPKGKGQGKQKWGNNTNSLDEPETEAGPKDASCLDLGCLKKASS